MSITDDALKQALQNKIKGVAGPFFLGFCFESFGMGVILVLSINYFLAILSRPKSPAESSRRLGVVLVALSLTFNIAQTIIDWLRGWTMFAIHFNDLGSLFRPSPLYFLSPFLGILPALLNQIFLLRRTLLFISSLSAFWPRLAHPRARWIFGTIMGLCIVNSTVAGMYAAVEVWKSTHLWSLRREDRLRTAFQIAELDWLATSAGVDVILSLVLCVELWWARKQLAAKGGTMREVVTKLMLVTFNGGLAVTVIQLYVLFLYQFSKGSAWCYFPMLSLPKVYTITLILSLSLLHAKAAGPTPSHVFSLPTILTQHNDTQTPPSSPPQPRRASSPAVLSVHSIHTPESRLRDKKDIKKSKKRFSGIVQDGWKNSQHWLGWSLNGNGMTKGGKEEALNHHRHAWSRHENHVDLQPLGQPTGLGQYDHRRPSEPNSISPLLSPRNTRPQPPLTLPPLSQPLSPHSRPFPHSTQFDPPLPSPPCSMTVHRQHSFSRSFSPRRDFLAPIGPYSQPMGIGPSVDSIDHLFDPSDPFASTQSFVYPPAATNPTASTNRQIRPALAPIYSAERHGRDHGSKDGDGGDGLGDMSGREDEEYLGMRRQEQRMMSFEDMLAFPSERDKEKDKDKKR